MAEQMYITPSNDTQKSHIRDTRYVSNNDQLSDNIKKMMDLDIIRDLAMKTITEDSTISYDVAFKIAKAEYYGEEIEIPIPPIEIEEEEFVNETLDDNTLKDQVNIDTISDVEIPVTQKAEDLVEPNIESIEEISVPLTEIRENETLNETLDNNILEGQVNINTISDIEIPVSQKIEDSVEPKNESIEEISLPTNEKESNDNELPKLVDFNDLIMPEINIDANVELPTEELFTNENIKNEEKNNVEEVIETFDNFDNVKKEIKAEDIQIPLVETKREEQLDTTKALTKSDDQLLNNLLDIDVTNNFSDLDSILLNNEEIFKSEPITQKIK